MTWVWSLDIIIRVQLMIKLLYLSCAVCWSLKHSCLLRLINYSSAQSITIRSFSMKNLLWKNVCSWLSGLYSKSSLWRSALDTIQIPCNLDPLQYFFHASGVCFISFENSHIQEEIFEIKWDILLSLPPGTPKLNRVSHRINKA